MKTGQKGLDLIKHFEGFRANPYLDSVGVPTIGYGATYYPGGKKVTIHDTPINESEATDMLANMLGRFETAVTSAVKHEINQNQFDALVSFVYNLGPGSLQQSTLLKKLNVNPNDPTIREEFSKWVKAGGKTLPGLVTRRAAEADLYFTPVSVA